MVVPSQQSFWKQITEGEMPEPHRQKYEEFRSLVPGDHLIHVIFSCNCWRFIEVRSLYRGRGMHALPGGRVLQKHDKYEYLWSYYYPQTKTQCGARVVDESWIRRRLKIFSFRVGYKHDYADDIFRTRAEQEIKQTLEIVGSLQ